MPKKKSKTKTSKRPPEQTGSHPIRVRAILDKLEEAYPAAECELTH
jgi:hypothetical protein